MAKKSVNFADWAAPMALASEQERAVAVAVAVAAEIAADRAVEASSTASRLALAAETLAAAAEFAPPQFGPNPRIHTNSWVCLTARVALAQATLAGEASSTRHLGAYELRRDMRAAQVIDDRLAAASAAYDAAYDAAVAVTRAREARSAAMAGHKYGGATHTRRSALGCATTRSPPPPPAPWSVLWTERAGYARVTTKTGFAMCGVCRLASVDGADASFFIAPADAPYGEVCGPCAGDEPAHYREPVRWPARAPQAWRPRARDSSHE
jgi:hypothetical protein